MPDKGRILFVDDDECWRFLFDEEMTSEGYEVFVADSGYRLLEKIEETKPDVLVLDMKMQEFNGVDLAQGIRNRYYNLPIILHSGYDTLPFKAKVAGFDHYVIKSSDLTELKNRIQYCIESNIV